jgi:hypothetical protein
VHVLQEARALMPDAHGSIQMLVLKAVPEVRVNDSSH